MRLEHLLIHQFRCIARFESDLPSGRILLVGDNATGKTSVMEAIYYLVTGRSFRTRYDNDCVPWRGPAGTLAAVRGRVRRDAGDSCQLAVTLGPGVKTVRIDDQPLARLAELWGRLHAVLFTPEDLQLVKGGPGERRRFLDMALSQVDGRFLFHLQRYQHALRQRNALLRNPHLADRVLRENIAPWDTQMAEHGLPVIRGRVEFLDALEPRLTRLHGHVAGAESPGETLRIVYVNSLRLDLSRPDEETRVRFHDILMQNLDEDRRRGQTQQGPHRDEFSITLAGKQARDFASQGQARTITLALRLAEALELEQRSGESPVILLDDLASELDPRRKERVLELLHPEWQTFLTTTHREDFPSAPDFQKILPMP